MSVQVTDKQPNITRLINSGVIPDKIVPLHEKRDFSSEIPVTTAHWFLT